MVERADHHRGEISELLYPYGRGSDTGITLPLRENENVVVFMPRDAEELVAAQGLAQQNPVRTVASEFDRHHHITLVEIHGPVKSV